MVSLNVDENKGNAYQGAAAWAAEHWSGADTPEYREALVASGYAVPSWPVEAHGKSYSRKEAKEVAEAFAAAGAPHAAQETAPFHENPWLMLAGGPILQFGTDEQKQRIIADILTKKMSVGCLLYSEPGAGSDLAGLQTRADRNGDEYVINGQKVWTTGGQEADFALLVARTDWDVPKHAGISFFIFPMKQAGVEVRPIKQLTGDAEFNEVFLTDARVPAANLIGGEGNGWQSLQVALAAERRGMGEMAMATSHVRDTEERDPIFTKSNDLVDAAREAGKLQDPVILDELMRIHIWRMTNDWNNLRAVSQMKTGASSLASLGKLANSRILHGAAALTFRLLGTRALQYDKAADPTAYDADYQVMFSFINSIGGGSDQIQRNIISERVLGLPKGIEPDKGVPFRDVLKADATKSLGQTN